MVLQKIHIKKFRNIENATLSFQSKLNIIYGENGSGKSSLLEALYFLGTGKSFRTKNSDLLIMKNEDKFSLFSQIHSEFHNQSSIGIERKKGLMTVKANGEFIRKASELSKIIPIQIIGPTQHQLIENGPEFRRRFLDWGVFHVEPQYEDMWKIYRRHLSQRNAALKFGLKDSELQHWDIGISNAAIEIDRMRRSYLDRLHSRIQVEEALPEQLIDCIFDYYQGWTRDLSYLECLKKNLHSDREHGYTQYGPHRADIKFKVGSGLIKEIYSRGQQKLLISALLIFQCKVIKDVTNKSTVLLIDDFNSELDDQNITSLLKIVLNSPCQTIITSTSKETLDQICGGTKYSMFHVEHGHVNQVA